jgi:hypothetical protein
MATAILASDAPVARLPVGRGRPGTVEAGVGHPDWLPVDAPVAWFRGTPTGADTQIVTDIVATGVEAGVPVVGARRESRLVPQPGDLELHRGAA